MCVNNGVERINVLLDTSKKIIFTIPQSNCLNKGYDFVLNRFKFKLSLAFTAPNDLLRLSILRTGFFIVFISN